jgi:hypothetical protein
LTLREPEVRKAVLEATVKSVSKKPNGFSSQPLAPAPVVKVEDETIDASVFPAVQPMKAALYFDSVDGFGEWRIHISSRAQKDLRDARRTDGKYFRIIVKKIK